MANVLIVDDDAALREGLAETVADLGHAPRVRAPRGARLSRLYVRTISTARTARFANAGGMDGIEVLRRIREENDAPPVIVLTAFATAETPLRQCSSALSII